MCEVMRLQEPTSFLLLGELLRPDLAERTVSDHGGGGQGDRDGKKGPTLLPSVHFLGWYHLKTLGLLFVQHHWSWGHWCLMYVFRPLAG